MARPGYGSTATRRPKSSPATSGSCFKRRFMKNPGKRGRTTKLQSVGQCFFDRARERDHIVVAQIAFDDMPLLVDEEGGWGQADIAIDRKSTRLNSSH